MQYRAEIDGLRAVAVLPVMLFHAGFALFSGGFVGVDVFFVISGYLITTIILSDLETGQFSITGFYERRARRILPVLFFVMAVCLPAAWFLLLPSDMTSFAKSLLSISGFVSNAFFWSERGYFGTATELKPLIHTWSLAIEEQYYLVFPFLMMLLIKKRKTLLMPVLVSIGLASFGICVWLTRLHVDSAFYLLPTRFWELLVGSFVAIQCTYQAKALSSSAHYKSTLEILGFSLIVLPIFLFDNKTAFPGYAALAPTVGAAMVIRNSSSTTLLGRVLSAKILVGVGLISYSAYLWHQPLFAFARHAYFDAVPHTAFYALLVLALALSYFSWRFVEKPFRNKAVWSRQGVFTFSAGGLLLFSTVGLVGWKTDGLMARYSPADQRLLRSFIGAGDYTATRFDKLKLVDFPVNADHKKVLIIGDSFGKDLVNAVAESELSKHLTISTHQINSECGNLYVDQDFTKFIATDKRARCKLIGWYEEERLQKLIKEADAIWLASAWTDWVAKLLPASVKNIEQRFGKPVLVFGRKNFGIINEKAILAMTVPQRLAHAVAMDPRHTKVQQLMKEGLPSKNFVDLSELLCASDVRCRVFTNQGWLISYDGEHLTRDGATHLGALITVHPSIALSSNDSVIAINKSQAASRH
jgi:peptidoglycan/LPS O-acetylase OafA/YrhL